MEAPSREGGARVHGHANFGTVGAVEGCPKLKNDAGQVALNGDRHLLLEWANRKDRDVHHKNLPAPAAAGYPAARSQRAWGGNE
jgi:hypothetical protein